MLAKGVPECENNNYEVRKIPDIPHLKTTTTKKTKQLYLIIQHTEAWINWSPFCRRKLLLHFIERKYRCFNSNSLNFVLEGSTDINSALIRVMAWCHSDENIFTWSNDDPIQGYINAASGLNELMSVCGVCNKSVSLIYIYIYTYIHTYIYYIPTCWLRQRSSSETIGRHDYCIIFIESAVNLTVFSFRNILTHFRHLLETMKA